MKQITNGTIVAINFHNSRFTLCTKARVILLASQSGEFSVFEDLDTGVTHYISEPCTLTIVEEAGL